MLDEKTIVSFRQTLEQSAHPLFLFHDDPDGSTSFMQLQKWRGEGRGIIVKTGPRITVDFVRKVQESGADLVVILDIALVDEAFIQQAGVPIVWLDHHGLEEPHGSAYINPRAWGQSTPPCYMSYQVTGKKDPWLAMIGCVGDWFMPPPDLVTTFRVRYPEILGASENDFKIQEFAYPEDFMFKSKVGILVHMLSFNLKGKSQDAMTAIKIFSRLDGPMELLEDQTPRARWLTRRFRKIQTLYSELKEDAVRILKSQHGLLGVYETAMDRCAISKDLSNELSYIFPEKVIIVAREKSGEMKISIRSNRTGPVIDKALEKALIGIDGHGGGHERACGANVKKQDFEAFVENFKRELGIKMRERGGKI